MIQNYIAYLKDNPQKLWFKRKLYGWGWAPATWQGWATLLVFIAMLSIDSILLDSNPEPTPLQINLFLVKIVLNVGILIGICYAKGEVPRWQWGIPKNTNNN